MTAKRTMSTLNVISAERTVFILNRVKWTPSSALRTLESLSYMEGPAAALLTLS
jgi:hypothetical protein